MLNHKQAADWQCKSFSRDGEQQGTRLFRDLYGDNLGTICGILEDEPNEINLADDFLISSIEEVRKIKMYWKDQSQIRGWLHDHDLSRLASYLPR